MHEARVSSNNKRLALWFGESADTANVLARGTNSWYSAQFSSGWPSPSRNPYTAIAAANSAGVDCWSPDLDSMVFSICQAASQ